MITSGQENRYMDEKKKLLDVLWTIMLILWDLTNDLQYNSGSTEENGTIAQAWLMLMELVVDW